MYVVPIGAVGAILALASLTRIFSFVVGGAHFSSVQSVTWPGILWPAEIFRYFKAVCWLVHKAMSVQKLLKAGVLWCLVLVVICITILYPRYLTDIQRSLPDDEEELKQEIRNLDDSLDFGARPQVKTNTSWNAPIIWEGMFNPQYYDQMHIELHSAVAITVFAVGRYLDAYLNTFLTSAEQHFMLGLPVTYYVFTDLPEKVPALKLGPQRKMKVITVQKHSRWQDISMMRMKTISELIEAEVSHSFRYIFCFDVDQEFKGRFGSEALGESVALLHAHFYNLPKNRFTYDRNPKSQAYMETGDFYYHAAIFGGYWENVKNLTDTCYANIIEDKKNNVEALWHDESHLNKYFWQLKPHRLLSPEYCWDMTIPYRGDIHVIRLIWGQKQYATLRDH